LRRQSAAVTDDRTQPTRNQGRRVQETPSGQVQLRRRTYACRFRSPQSDKSPLQPYLSALPQGRPWQAIRIAIGRRLTHAHPCGIAGQRNGGHAKGGRKRFIPTIGPDLIQFPRMVCSSDPSTGRKCRSLPFEPRQERQDDRIRAKLKLAQSALGNGPRSLLDIG